MAVSNDLKKAKENNIPYDEHEDVTDSSQSDLKPDNLPKRIQDFFEGNYKDGYIIAGARVRDKVGGPDLLVIGFSNYNDTIAADGTIKYRQQIYDKVYVNFTKKTDFELYGGSYSSEEISDFHFFNLINDTRRSTGSKTFNVICKFWDRKQEQFQYISKKIFEIEEIKSKLEE